MFSSNRPHSDLPRTTENLIGVSTKEDGFTIKRLSGSPIKEGDLLLISYKTNGTDWHKTEVAFEDKPKGMGMTIFTGQRPTDIIIAVKFLVENAQSAVDVPVTRHTFTGKSRALSQTNLRDLSVDNNYGSSPFYGMYSDDPLNISLLHHFRTTWHSDSVFTPSPSLPPVPQDETYSPSSPSPFSVPVQDSPPEAVDLSTSTIGDIARSEISGVAGASDNPFDVTSSGVGSAPFGAPESDRAEVSGVSGLGPTELGNFGDPKDQASPFGGEAESKDEVGPGGLDSVDNGPDAGSASDGVSSSSDPTAYC